MSNLLNISVVVLAGGMGTRLRPVLDNRQKIIAEVSGRPFLVNILEKLDSAGFKDIVLCTGYLGEQVKKEIGKRFKNLKISYSNERTPLGTAGALRKALTFLKSETILVMNGDSFCDVDLKKFYEFHVEQKANVSLVLSCLLETSRYGNVVLDYKNQIIGFKEKNEKSGSGWISVGIYLFNRSMISKISRNKKISLEKDIFPDLIGQKFYGYKSKGRFIDIGTPESYKEAEKFFTKKQEKKRFILLDRDGTIVVHRKYLSHPDQLELIPGAGNALRRLQELGFGLLVITNQSGIGRGFFDLKILNKIHHRFEELLSKESVILDGIYFCPHLPEDNCLCRKPNILLVEKAIKKYNFDPKLSFVIGDNVGDIKLGKNIGATTILVKTGYGKETAKNKEVISDYTANDFNGAVRIISKEISNKS